MDMIDLILKYVVVPVAGFIWVLHNKVTSHHTDIAVLKAETAARKEAHDREMKEMRETVKAIFEKLNSIEEALRK